MSKQTKYQRKVERKTRADEREARTGMRQSYGAMIFKIVMGLLFIIVGFAPGETALDVTSILMSIVIGLGFIAWALVPLLGVKRKKELEDAALDKQILNTPLNQFGKEDPFADQAEQLAKHYEKKE